MRDTFLFDLDGTLLPFDIEDFMKIYFGEGKTFPRYDRWQGIGQIYFGLYPGHD